MTAVGCAVRITDSIRCTIESRGAHSAKISASSPKTSHTVLSNRSSQSNATPELPTLQEADEEMREGSPERLSCSQPASGPLFFSDMPEATFLESSGPEVSAGAAQQRASAPAPTFSLDACPSFAEQRGRSLFLERHATLQRAVFDSVEEGDEEGDGVPLPSKQQLHLQDKSACPYLPGWGMPGSDIWSKAGDALKTMDAEAAKLHFEPPAGFSPFGLSRCRTIARTAPLGLGSLALEITTAAEPKHQQQQQQVAFAAGLAAATTAGAAVSTAGGILAAAASAGVAAGPQAAINAGANMLLNRLQSMAVRKATSAAADSILGPNAAASSANQLKQRLRACVCGASVMFFLVNVVSMQDSLSSIDFDNDIESSIKLVLDVVTSGPSVMENCRELLQRGVMTTLGVGQRAGGIAGAGSFGGGGNFDFGAGAGLLQGMLSATGNGGN